SLRPARVPTTAMAPANLNLGLLTTRPAAYRRSRQPQSRVRTFTLRTTTAVSLLALLAWASLRKVYGAANAQQQPTQYAPWRSPSISEPGAHRGDAICR